MPDDDADDDEIKVFILLFFQVLLEVVCRSSLVGVGIFIFCNLDGRCGATL